MKVSHSVSVVWSCQFFLVQKHKQDLMRQLDKLGAPETVLTHCDEREKQHVKRRKGVTINRSPTSTRREASAEALLRLYKGEAIHSCREAHGARFCSTVWGNCPPPPEAQPCTVAMTQPRFYPPSDSSPFSFLNTKWPQIFLKGIRKHKSCVLYILQEKPPFELGRACCCLRR